MLPQATEADFAAPQKECDLVLKGGVTSGIVYPNAILELAKAYRFRSIGGASAGGIAAAFAAAAEFARQSGDPGGFVRLEQTCLTLPARLQTLFQPARSLRPLMALAKGFIGGGPLVLLGALFVWLPLTALAGIAAGLAVASRSDGLGMALSCSGGLLIAFGLRLALLANLARRNAFGVCSGLTVDGAYGPALTDWLHASLQHIAYGDQAAAQKPLTFGDLRTAGRGLAGRATKDKAVNLRMMTTNLSLGRPHALPDLPGGIMYRPSEWARLFPADVMRYLASPAVSKPTQDPELVGAPKEDDLPVLVAVRMSLSFPLLISAVRMAIQDVGAAQRAELRGADTTPPVRTVWLTDGGLTSNFPIHFFDALLPNRPTFAISLDALPPGEPPGPSRVSLPQDARGGIFLPIQPITGWGALFGALFGVAKDWQDNALSVMGGQRERIVRVALASDEGGLNLAMPEDQARDLMAYGAEAGRMLREDFDFDEHRWRRTLITYEQLEVTIEALDQSWSNGFQTWFQAYRTHPLSYRPSNRAAWPVFLARGAAMDVRLTAVAGLHGAFQPPLRHAKSAFPKPSGRLRVVPDL